MAELNEEVDCFVYCAENEADDSDQVQTCIRVCLGLSSKNAHVYRAAMKYAEDSGFFEEDTHIFAAGAVWQWQRIKSQESR